MSFWGGTEGKMKQYSTMTPEQMGVQSGIYDFLQGGKSNMPGGDYMQSLFSNDPSAFRAYEAPMMRQFNEEVVPGLAERFSGSGMGGRQSSAFQNQMGQAGMKLSEALGAQRANLRQGAMSNIMQMLGLSQTPTFENVYQAGQPGAAQGIFSGLAQGVGAGMMSGFNPIAMGGGFMNGLFSGQQQQQPQQQQYGGGGGGYQQQNYQPYRGYTNQWAPR